MVTTRQSDQQGSKSRQIVMRLYTQWHRPILKRLINPPLSIPRETSIDSDCGNLLTVSVLSNKADKLCSIGFNQQVKVSQGHTSYRNKENRNTEVHGGGHLERVKPVRKPASSRPKPCASLKRPTNLARLPLLEEKRWSDISFSFRNRSVRSLDSRAQGISSPMARQRSSRSPPLPNLVRTCPTECYQSLRNSPPCLSRSATPPEGHQIGARKRRAPGNTILSQPYGSTDRLNREGSQLPASL